LNNQLQQIWMYADIPLSVREELCLPNTDKGIDLLVKINGAYFPIQCKFRRDTQIIVPWGDLATFFELSFGITKKVNEGYFVTNTFDLCEQVILSERVKPIYGNFFDGLPDNFFLSIRDHLNGNKTIVLSRWKHHYHIK
jgi:hypothetical protein